MVGNDKSIVCYFEKIKQKGDPMNSSTSFITVSNNTPEAEFQNNVAFWSFVALKVAEKVAMSVYSRFNAPPAYDVVNPAARRGARPAEGGCVERCQARMAKIAVSAFGNTWEERSITVVSNGLKACGMGAAVLGVFASAPIDIGIGIGAVAIGYAAQRYGSNGIQALKVKLS